MKELVPAPLIAPQYGRKGLPRNGALRAVFCRPPKEPEEPIQSDLVFFSNGFWLSCSSQHRSKRNSPDLPGLQLFKHHDECSGRDLELGSGRLRCRNRCWWRTDVAAEKVLPVNCQVSRHRTSGMKPASFSWGRPLQTLPRFSASTPAFFM